jgi:hypothetical protein
MKEPRTQTKLAKIIFLTLGMIAIPVLLKLIDILETWHPFAMFRLATFILVFFLLTDLAALVRGKWRNFLLVPASLTFGICLIEGAANIWEPKELTVVSPPYGLYTKRPIIGEGPDRAGLFHQEKTGQSTGATIYSVDYTIDSNLLRHTQSCETGPAIVFFGCSFMFGAGLNDADTLAQAFADSLDRKERVLNLGFPGYGPQQFLSEMQSGLFDPVIGPQPRLFVFLTGVWHAERSSCKSHFARNSPRYILENGQLLLEGICREGFSLRLREWLWNSAAYRVFIEPYERRVTHDDVELYTRLMLAAIDLAKKKYGVPAIVLYLKAPAERKYLQGTGFSEDMIMQRLRDSGAAVIDASLDKEEATGATITIPGDGHPTALANRLRAGNLKNYLEQNMSGILVSGLP